MPRINLPSPEAMNPEQRRVYDQVVSGPRGKVVGPLRAALHSPELAERWQALGAFLRYGTTLPPRLSELAILVTGRACDAPFEWYAHRIEAEKAGIETPIIEALLAPGSAGRPAPDDALVIRYAVELNRYNSVSDATYAAALARFGERARRADRAGRLLHDGRDDAQRPRDPAARGGRAGFSAAAGIDAMTGRAGIATPTCSVRTIAILWRPIAATRRPRRSRRTIWRCSSGWAWHGVLVHPSAYGSDFSLLFDALAAHAVLRGVIVATPGLLPSSPGLRERGIRGARFSHRSGSGANFAGSASFSDLQALAPQLADAGLHAELWTDCKVLPDIAARSGHCRFRSSSITWVGSILQPASTRRAFAACALVADSETSR